MQKSFQSNAIDSPECDYLFVRDSQLTSAGKGLFTAIDIYKDEIIAHYLGEVLKAKIASQRAIKGLDQYFVNMVDGSVLDAMHVEGYAKYANDAIAYLNAAFHNNAIIALDEEDRVCLVAKRNIRSGEEIFCAYGKKYWKKHRA